MQSISTEIPPAARALSLSRRDTSDSPRSRPRTWGYLRNFNRPRMGRSGVIASFAERFTSESPPRLGCRTTQNRPSATFSRHFAHDTNFDLRRIASDFLTRRIRMGEGELHRRYRVREPHSTRNTTSPEKCIYTLSGVIRYVLLARRASAQARGTRVKARHRRNDRNSSLARRANGNELTNRSRLISDREKYIPIF